MDSTTVNRCEFSEVFEFAEERAGIRWNLANDLFFNNLFDFRSVTELYRLDILERIYSAWHISFSTPEEQVVEKLKSLTKDELFALTDARSLRANVVMLLFMEQHNVSTLEVDSR